MKSALARGDASRKEHIDDEYSFDDSAYFCLSFACSRISLEDELYP
jgi:hypothetical protein